MSIIKIVMKQINISGGKSKLTKLMKKNVAKNDVKTLLKLKYTESILH
jgi:hypothetical protein